jgi:hypothetical protein
MKTMFNVWLFRDSRRDFSSTEPEDQASPVICLGGAMQVGQIGGIGDFGKIALLRHLMKDRRLAVCWYLTGESDAVNGRGRHFDYLKRPDDFRHFAPEVFDRLAEFDGGSRALIDPLTDLQMSRILDDAVFLRQRVPRPVSLRRQWLDALVESVRGSNLVFLDPDAGIQGKRLTPGHVALEEISALRLPDRALIIGHQQSGRRSEVKFIANQMRSVGCDPVAIIRLRLVASRFYVIADHDAAITELIATFVRRWGDRVKSYSV